jgi:hypothetical protein
LAARRTRPAASNVEIRGEHRCREESHRAQRLLARVGEIVTHRRGQHKNAARPDRVRAAVLKVEQAAAGDDVLAFFGGVGVPAEPLAGSIS